MQTEPGNSSLIRLLIVQAQVAFNDNAAKLTLAGLANLVLLQSQVPKMVGLMAALLVLPFILFSPVCGWAADRFSKTKVLRLSLAFQVLVTGMIAVAVLLHRFDFATASFFLLALQATAFSPAKQGILKELVGSERLNAAVSWMESSTIAAILLGGFGGGLLLDGLTKATGDHWHGAALALGILTLACASAWLIFRRTPVLPAQSTEPFRASLFWEHFSYLKRLANQPSLFGVAAGIAWFYGLGGLLYLLLIQIGRETHPGIGAASFAGWLLTLLGGGIIAGALLYARLSKGKVSLRALPLSAINITAALVLLAALPKSGWVFQIVLFGLGLASGTFIIPLNTYLQDNSQSHERGQMLSAGNLLTNLAGILAVGAQVLLVEQWHATATGQFIYLAITAAIATLVAAWCQPERALRLAASILARTFYRVKITGQLPETGGVLLVCNHVSYVDAFIVGVYFRRRVRFLAYDEFFKAPFLGAVLRASSSIPISSRHPKEGTVKAIELLRAGEVVCIFPEGELTRTGEVMGFRRGMELIARRAKVPVVPVYLDMFWGSIFSFTGGKYFWKWPGELPRRLGISIGAPMQSEVHAEEARQAILSLGVETFGRRKELTPGLGWTALRRLKSNASKPLVVDCMKEPATLNCGEALAMSLTLAKRWRRTLHGRRIGIILPPGRAAIIANLAVVFAGKTPVNLNPTVALGAAETTLKVADIEEVITAGIARRLLSKYPWPQATRKMEDEIAAVSKGQLGFALAGIWALPWRLLAAIYGVEQRDSNEEAILLFTSGSSGDPKAVVLTHGNILANVTQISLIGLLTPEDRILGCLPLFHSFGSTFTLWMPLLHDIGLVTTPSPLDASKVGAAAEAGKATILVGTPTFLRTFARKVTPEQFHTVKLAVAGAEKLPPELVQTYQEKYGIAVYEGYGLTETSPVLAVNLPNPAQGEGATSEQPASRPGSVGRLLPGLAYRLVDPETGAAVEPEKIGVLQVQGASVFTGYLKDHQRTAEVLRDEWFVTGDLARVDADGFLFIEGRLSRFAKIGGEMVPLVKIEECIVKELQIDSTASQSIALVSISHPTKGEELVLLSVPPIEREALRQKLMEAGLPNLWIPRAVCPVTEIPMLATGKIDWQTCKRIAAEFGAKETPDELPAA